MSRIGEQRLGAVIEAVENADRWAGGAVVVEYANGYEAIPFAYLQDVSWTGSRRVYIDLRNGLIDAIGFDLTDSDAASIAAMLIEKQGD